MSSSPNAAEDPPCRGRYTLNLSALDRDSKGRSPHVKCEAGKSLRSSNPFRKIYCIATLNAVPLGLGSNPGEDMDVYKYIVPSRHGGTLNSRRAAIPLLRLVAGEERWEAHDYRQGVLPQNWGENELNRSVTCMVLKATVYDRHHLALCHDEFRDLDFSDLVALVTTTENMMLIQFFSNINSLSKLKNV
ncbi:uncharacterized protein TNCV_4068601 [Trichonephila clavipes]|nr:uncharacterized protein TNCV_4068601 [Trichonephila clavipes]